MLLGSRFQWEIFIAAEIQITTREYLTIKNADLGSSCGLRRALASCAL